MGAMAFPGATIPDRAHGALLQTRGLRLPRRVLPGRSLAFINLTHTAFYLHGELA